MVYLQWMHLLENEIRRSRLSRWADWVVPPLPPSTVSQLPEGVCGSMARDNDVLRGDELTGKNPVGGHSSTAGDAIACVKAPPQGLIPLSSWWMKDSKPPSAAFNGEKVLELDKEGGVSEKGNGAVGRVVETVLREFERAEEDVDSARQALVKKGFCRPNPGHMLQVLRNARESSGPGGSSRGPSLFLATAVLALRGDDTEGVITSTRVTSTSCEAGSTEDIIAESLDKEDMWFGASDGDKEALGSWGFRDSGFSIASDRADGGDPYVVMRGTRWEWFDRAIALYFLFFYIKCYIKIEIPTEFLRACVHTFSSTNKNHFKLV